MRGQGPEHSSARLERYLQLCAEQNMQVCNITTPGNYFHALRRQMKRNYRKPLIIMTPKSLLRHKLAVSPLSEMEAGTTFRKVIGETEALVAPDQVRRVVISTGKSLLRPARGAPGAGHPGCSAGAAGANLSVPRDGAAHRADALPQRRGGVVPGGARETWAPGPSSTRRLERVLVAIDAASKRPRYVGRTEAASPATGSAKVHAQEQAALVAVCSAIV